LILKSFPTGNGLYYKLPPATAGGYNRFALQAIKSTPPEKYIEPFSVKI